jgi:alpha-galactosidase/6-phospho-beta-glucosidase family protein
MWTKTQTVALRLSFAVGRRKGMENEKRNRRTQNAEWKKSGRRLRTPSTENRYHDQRLWKYPKLKNAASKPEVADGPTKRKEKRREENKTEENKEGRKGTRSMLEVLILCNILMLQYSGIMQEPWIL